MSSQSPFLALRAAVHMRVWNVVMFYSWWKCHKEIGGNLWQSLIAEGNFNVQMSVINKWFKESHLDKSLWEVHQSSQQAREIESWSCARCSCLVDLYIILLAITPSAPFLFVARRRRERFIGFQEHPILRSRSFILLDNECCQLPRPFLELRFELDLLQEGLYLIL